MTKLIRKIVLNEHCKLLNAWRNGILISIYKTINLIKNKSLKHLTKAYHLSLTIDMLTDDRCRCRVSLREITEKP